MATATRDLLDEIEKIEDLRCDESFKSGDSLFELYNVILTSKDNKYVLRIGQCCEWDDSVCDYLPDWDFVLIHRNGDPVCKYLYCEQGCIATTLHNFAYAFHMNEDSLIKSFSEGTMMTW